MSRILVLLIAFSVVGHLVYGQSAEVATAQTQVNRILEDSSKHFRDGLIAYSQSRRVDAGEKFDDAVEVFLSSALNIQGNQQLQTCYTQLIETVYRLEFSSGNQIPQLKPLSAACGWKWSETDFRIADKVVAMTAQKKLVDPKAATPAGSVTSVAETFGGFEPQEFTPALGDELARLELTQAEKQIEGERVSATSYSRLVASPVASNVKIVKAQSGDTISKLVTRHGADPVEVAKYNGLLVNSLLGSGREIKIPSSSPSSNKYSSRPQLQPIKIFSSDTSVPCKDDVKPTVRGLKLGMSPSDVSRALGRRVVPKKYPGYLEGATGSMIFGVKETRGILVSFYKGSLYSILVRYDDFVKWAGIDEFQEAIAKSLGLSEKWNQKKYSTTGELELDCANFNISVARIINNYQLMLTDSDTEERMFDDLHESTKRRNQVNEQKKRAFKP